MTDADRVQERGWGGAKPVPPPSTFTFGLVQQGNPVNKASGWRTCDRDKEKICPESQQTKEDGGVSRHDHRAWVAGTHRQGCVGTSAGVGSAFLLSCPYQQATGYPGFRRSKEKLLIREVCDWSLFGSSPDKGSFYS